MNSDVYLIDGSGYIFRAYYAIAPLTTSEGFPTNALFGFTRMLLKLIREADSDHLLMVFDAGKKTFRNEIYSLYKANRDECPDDLAKQMPYFRKISQALGLPILELVNYEADDVIGTLAARFKASKQKTVIVSGDKDLMQLVSDDVSVWDTMKDRHYSKKEVKDKFGIGPELLVEYLALAGDSSDNIPGLKGCGPKTAVQLLDAYGSVENILAAADQVKEDKSIRNRKKIAQAIESDGELLRLSRKLVEICTDAPVLISSDQKEVNISEVDDELLWRVTKRQDLDPQLLGALSAELEFTSLLSDFGLEVAKSEARAQPKSSYQTVLAKDFTSFLEKLKSAKEFAFDLETTDLDPLEAKIVGASFCWDDEEAFYIPVAHQGAEGQIDFNAFKEALVPILTDESIKKIGQNLKFDISVLMHQGIAVKGLSFDTMIAAYLLNPERNALNLGALAKDYLGRSVIEYDDIVAKGEDFASVSLNEATQYAAEDAHIAWLLKGELLRLLKEEELLSVLSDIEMPLVPVLAAMELKGVKLDKELLSKMSEELGEQLEKLKVKLHKLAGKEFNLNSPKQLSVVLFEDLGIPTKGVKKTKTGFSTNSVTLEKLAPEHELPRRILNYRMLHKLKSTYVDALPAQISSVDERLHSRFNQTITATGRLSSSEPNLQNIPIQTEAGRRVREAFIAEDGHVLISADYSQIELRVLAHMSGDENLIEAFASDSDIHSNTAREILNLDDEEELSVEMRRMGKVINFGIVYGMSGFRLARELEIPVYVANEYIDNYFKRYPGVRAYFDDLEARIENEKTVSTLFGRKRYVNEINVSGRDRGFATRAALNAPIQGTAADIIKLAMIALQNKIKNESLPLEIILQIHDELVFECAADYSEAALFIIQQEMEQVVSLDVPLKVEIGVGKNWLSAH